jgi:hypothetical protein
LVEEQQQAGATFESAVDQVAHERSIDPNKLSNFMRGKGSRRSRRFKAWRTAAAVSASPVSS